MDRTEIKALSRQVYFCRLGVAVADTVGEIYLNNRTAYYYVGWVERSETQRF